jgi:predicted NACHT family NTPase
VTQRPHKITFLKEEQSKLLSTERLELLFGPDYNVLTDQYLRHVIERFSKLTIYSVNSDSPLAVDLERVFITLRTTRRSIESIYPDFIGTDPILSSTRFTSALEAARTIRDRGKTNIWDIEYNQHMSIYVPDLPVNRVTIGEALSRSRNAVIIGSPGAGKTTLLKYLALTFARNRAEEQFGITESLVPLFITLRDFSRFLDNAAQRGELLDLSPKLLPDFITAHLRSVASHLNLPVEFFTHYLESSKCIVLLDGLDEVAEPLKRMRVAEAIDSFTQQYQGNRFVITSRPRGYEGEARQRLSAQYPDWMIQDFDDADMEKFTSSWYEAVTRDRLGDSTEAIAEARGKAGDLLRAIRADQRVAALAHNPLLLSVLAMVHQRGVGLPQRRAELYDECTDLLLGYWDQTKGGEAARELAQYGELDRTEKRTLLEPIALWFHERGQQNLEADKKELRQKIADQFQASFVDQNHVAQKRADLFLRVIDERAGLLVEREVSVYSFAHLTFQEYLAARSNRRL